MKKSALVIYSILISLFFTACIGGQGIKKGTSSAVNECIVTAPDSVTSEEKKYANASAELGVFGSKILSGGIEASTSQRLEIIYREIPDSLVACQMMLQLGACMASSNKSISKDYLLLVSRKNSCGKSSTDTAQNIGMKVYIHIADKTMLAAAKKVQIALSTKGFQVPKIEIMNGKPMPSFSDVRYYYNHQFSDAKLTRGVIASGGFNDVLLNPLYDLPNKPAKAKAYLEVWLTKSTEN